MATTGGHGTGIGYGNITGIDINLANLDSVSIDVANNYLTVGGGVTIGDVIQPLDDAGKVIREHRPVDRVFRNTSANMHMSQHMVMKYA